MCNQFTIISFLGLVSMDETVILKCGISAHISKTFSWLHFILIPIAIGSGIKFAELNKSFLRHSFIEWKEQKVQSRKCEFCYVPEGGEFQITVGVTCLRAHAGRRSETRGKQM